MEPILLIKYCSCLPTHYFYLCPDIFYDRNCRFDENNNLVIFFLSLGKEVMLIGLALETSFFCGFFPLKMKGPSGSAPVAVHIPTLPSIRWNSIFVGRIST